MVQTDLERTAGLIEQNKQTPPSGDPMDRDHRSPVRLRAILMIALGLFLLAALVVFFQGEHGTGSTPGARPTVEPAPIPAAHLVQVITPQRRDVARTLTLPA